MDAETRYARRATTYPERVWALILDGSFARELWAPDYPSGMNMGIDVRAVLPAGTFRARDTSRSRAPTTSRSPAARRRACGRSSGS